MHKYIVLLLLTLSTSLFATEDIFKAPKQQQLVVDSANMLSNTEELALKNKLNDFNNTNSTQILVYTTPSLYGYDIADFGQQIGEGWQVGQKGFDNGIVIIVKPRIGNEKGQVSIQTGYGVEALIPDATANRIINNEMIPHFKTGDFNGGINAAVDICISLTTGEFTAQTYNQSNEQSEGFGGFIFLFVILISILSMFGRSKRRYYNTGSRSSLPFWTAMFLMGNSSNRGSGWDNFSSGSGSFGGGSSFGGFGGGSFGGGGASGSW